LLQKNSDLSLELGSINKTLALIPVAAIFLTLTLMLALGLKGQFVFNSPIALLILTILFYLLVTPIVAYISAKSYLATGSLTLLFVSLAFFVGIPFSISIAAATSIPDLTVALGALGLLVSSTFQLSGAAQASFGSVPVGSEHRRLRLISVFLAVSVVCVMIVLFGFLGVYPTFFVNNVGITLADTVVYGFIISFFLAGGLLYMRLYLKSKSKTLFFYSLGLILYALGSFGITQQVVFGDAVVWVGRLSTYFGLIYFLYALLGSRQRK
jgi:hypothetical protein